MTNASRGSRICVLAVGMLVVAATSWAQNKKPPIVEQMAKTYGLDSWDQIEAIRYTFNIDLPGLIKFSRSWVWEPKTGQVSYDGKDKTGKPVKVTYQHSQLSSQPANVKSEIDPAFMNDQYWLVFPFHVYWDSSPDVKDEGKHKLPLGAGSADKVVVKYPSEAGGYTPGDTWTVFVGPNKRIEALDYHRGGTQKPTEVIVSWAGYKKAGPLLVSTEHRGTADGKPAHIFFTDVAVKLAGSNDWVNAK